MRCLLGVAAVVCSLSSPTLADRPRDVMHAVELPQDRPPQLISHILFLNRCTGGCIVKQGTTDSRTDHSDIIGVGQGTIPAFELGDNAWNQVKTCIANIMAPFNLTVTDVDPGAAEHFEVMIGGNPGDVGFPTGVGGVADYPCPSPGQCTGAFIPNALVFDFSKVWGGDITAICGTAAQEIAHAWTLDHAIPSSDPMTYNTYTTPLKYRDGAVCGSDCLYSCPGGGGGACNAFGVACSGTGYSGTHTCLGSGLATQDEVKTITALFGPAGVKAPTVKITMPGNGDAVQSGMAFPITATCDTSDGISEIDLSIDSMPTATLTASPAMFTGPSTLVDGTHHISVVCGTKLQASAEADIDIIVGQKCGSDSDCQMNFICYNSACIPGENAPGGLGTTCSGPSDCASGDCAQDGTTSECVVPCDPSNDHCPSGFGCLMAGASGVCWAGAAHGGGGCCNSGGNGGEAGSILFGLGFAALLVTRRKR